MKTRVSEPCTSYYCTTEGQKIMTELAQLNNWDLKGVHAGGLLGAARILGEQAPAKDVVAEIGTISDDATIECVRDLVQNGSRVVLIGDRNDISLYRSVLTAGATEYFAFPVDPRSIARALRPSFRSQTPNKRGNVIAVTGATGGVGASALAQNLAAFGASRAEGNTNAIIDLDMRFGGLAAELDCEFTPGLFDALIAPDRIDDTFLKASMQHVDENLSVYTAQTKFDADLAGYCPPSGPVGHLI